MNTPVAVHSGTLTIFGITLRTAVLDDGRRVISADDMERLFRAMADPALPEPSADEMAAITAFCRSEP